MQWVKLYSNLDPYYAYMGLTLMYNYGFEGQATFSKELIKRSMLYDLFFVAALHIENLLIKA